MKEKGITTRRGSSSSRSLYSIIKSVFIKELLFPLPNNTLVLDRGFRSPLPSYFLLFDRLSFTR